MPARCSRTARCWSRSGAPTSRASPTSWLGSPPGSLGEPMRTGTPSRSTASISRTTTVCHSRGHVLTTYPTAAGSVDHACVVHAGRRITAHHSSPHEGTRAHSGSILRWDLHSASALNLRGLGRAEGLTRPAPQRCTGAAAASSRGRPTKAACGIQLRRTFRHQGSEVGLSTRARGYHRVVPPVSHDTKGTAVGYLP